MNGYPEEKKTTPSNRSMFSMRSLYFRAVEKNFLLCLELIGRTSEVHFFRHVFRLLDFLLFPLQQMRVPPPYVFHPAASSLSSGSANLEGWQAVFYTA